AAWPPPPPDSPPTRPPPLRAARHHTYDEYLPRLTWPAGRRGTMLAAALAAIATLAVLAVIVGGAGAPAGSPYRIIAYPALLVAFGLPAAWSVIVMAWSAARYWRAPNGGGWGGVGRPPAR